MEQEYFHSRKDLFERVMMTGVFVGIIITVLALFFDAIYVQSTGFPFAVYINVTSLIFAVNILFLVFGPMYYGLMKMGRFGEVIYIALIVTATIFLLVKMKDINRTNNEHLNAEFRTLLSGIAILISVGACVLIPVLFHNRKFEKGVL